MQDEVKVTQADRNAAVRLLEQGGQDWQAKEIRLGQGDHFPIVQSLARHRHQAERETLARMESVAERYRHKKRGTVYEVVGTAELQVAEFINMPDEGDHLAIYRGEDGKLWARPYNEFHDGRFEPLPPAPEAGQ